LENSQISPLNLLDLGGRKGIRNKNYFHIILEDYLENWNYLIPLFGLLLGLLLLKPIFRKPGKFYLPKVFHQKHWVGTIYFLLMILIFLKTMKPEIFFLIFYQKIPLGLRNYTSIVRKRDFYLFLLLKLLVIDYILLESTLKKTFFFNPTGDF